MSPAPRIFRKKAIGSVLLLGGVAYLPALTAQADPYVTPAGQQIDTELQNVIASVLLGQKQPMAALKDAQKSALQAYNKK